jgi:hypothetical protein
MSKKLIPLASAVILLGLVLTGAAEAELVGWWKLDEGAGTVAADSSGYGHDGTITDATWETGQYGAALGFNGSAYVEFPAEAWSSIETQATFTFWAYGDPASQPQANFIFGAFQEAGNNESRVMCAHVPWSNGNVYFDTGGTTAGGYDRIQKAATAEEYAGSWQHWALVKNADTGDQQIYLNGVLWHSGTGMTRPMTGVTAFTIGAKPAITNFYFGMMDDVRLYDHVLTEDEIQAVLAGVGASFPLAMSPDPEDGAMLEATWANLSWRPGSFAVSHDMYFGTSFDDVNDGAEGTFVGNLADTFQVVGFAGFPAPEGLQPGTTYYWRIDEVNDANAASPWKGDVWSFWIPPKKAYEPYPADGAGFIDESVELSWTPGFGATLQYVYFGDNFDDVNTATGALPQTDSTFTPAVVEKEMNYYWRVDEFDGIVTHKGEVWSFSTVPDIPVTDPNLILWYMLDEAQGGRTIDWSGHGNHGAIEGAALWLEDGYDGPAFQLGGRDYVAVPNSDPIKLISTDSYSVAVHVKLENIDQQAILFHGLGCSTWASWFLGVAGGEPGVDAVPGSFVFGVRESGGAPYTAVSAPARANTWVHVAATYQDNMLRLYIDGVEISSAAAPLPWDSGEDLHIGADPGCGGRVYSTAAIDDLRIYDRALTETEVQEAMRVDPLLAWDPQPSSGRTVDIGQALPLSWNAGDNAAQHDVYFGEDKDAVENADASETAGIYKGRQSGTSYTPTEGVEWGTGPFYWRIDEYNTDGTITKGRVWSFTVADFILVDDFESYTDNDLENEAIWQHWIDGYGVPTNGAQAGYLNVPYAEQTIVHGGSQSMPLFYNNTGGVTNSEAELKLGSQPRDWTQEGVGELSIWFQGRPATVGSFVEGPAGTFTMTGSGSDIWGTADQFHFAYKVLTGPGTIIAKVDSIENTHNWAKAGVMIRETMDADSKYAFGLVSAASGVAFQFRTDTGAGADGTTEAEIAAPHWVKLERDVAGNFTASHSTNGSSWVPVSSAVPINIPMSSDVYVGLALTSHAAASTCEAKFSNVTISGTVGAQWTHQDVGIASNAAEPLYVAVSNAAGAPAVVAHDDPAAATIDVWTEWVIPLSAFSDQGINLADVDKIAIGLGTKGDAAAAGGSGKMYIDDIRLYRPRDAAGQ